MRHMVEDYVLPQGTWLECPFFRALEKEWEQEVMGTGSNDCYEK